MRSLVCITKVFGQCLFCLAIWPLYGQSASPVKPVSFSYPHTVATMTGDMTIAGVASGDFNRDGKGDLAVLTAPSSGGLGTITVYLGQADGTMRSGWMTKLNVTSSPDLKAGDFHSSGNLDLALIQMTNDSTGQLFRSVTLLPGKGDGTFQPASVTVSALASPLPGLPPSQALFADLDGDHTLDIVIGFTLFRGKGDGTFLDPVKLAFLPVLIADLNGDGIPDVVSIGTMFTLPGQPLSIYNFIELGLGGGSFGVGHSFSGSSLSTSALLAGDFDGDGKIDLADLNAVSELCGASGGGVRIFPGYGDGTFRIEKSFPAIGGDLLTADFNRDGIPDLLTGFGFALGKGNGDFMPAQPLLTPSYQGPRAIGSGCGATIAHSAVFDANGDGLTDIAYAFNDTSHQQPSQLLLFLNAGSGDGILASAVPPSAYSAAPPARLSIASVYGLNLSLETATADGLPLPITLGGIRLHIGDQLASLLFVSPTQINYLMPDFPNPDTTFSSRTIGIERVGLAFVPHGIAAPSVAEAPAFFALNSNNLAAAYAVRVAADGGQTPVPVADCSQNPCSPIPIDTGGDPVYLSLFATGLNTVIAGNPSPYFQCSGGTVTYAGPQGSFPGLQQVNLRLDKARTPGTVSTVPIGCAENASNPPQSLSFINAVNVQVK